MRYKNREILILAGSCMFESEEQAYETARYVKAHQANVYRAKIWGGGTHKPKDKKLFGIGGRGFRGMAKIQTVLKMPVITEVRTNQQNHQWLSAGFDWIWTASRDMQDYSLLININSAHTGKGLNVILKRGFGNTIDEVVGATEYLHSVKNLWLCERGINTFDRRPGMRWRPDIMGIVELKKKGFKVLFDPSHSTGKAEYVIPMSLAALAAGADGIIVEVHKNPQESWSDKEQALNFDQYKELIEKIRGE